MKSSARIDSLVFQLTPTRTRCDLVIIANGKSEKIASGLLSPFLAHLKSAQEQIGKGGYSIILEPGRDTNAAWFTKGTVDRFVRFVSTPEILERVYTIESEIAQTEEAITFLKNNDTALPAQVQELQLKDEESNEGHKSALAANEEKAIVLYKPDGLPPDNDGSSVEDGNSRIQLLKVLETRKSVLQKEQGMAFARAVVAGFDIDHIAPLVSFSECFGALRMMEACSRFVELWKAKHESGQWLEMESVEAISSPADFASLNASGMMAPNLIDKQKESWSQSELGSGNNDFPSVATNGDGTTQHGPPHFQEQYPGQFPHPLYPSWPNYPQAGQLPMFQAYPVPVPYYQNYAGNGPFFQPAYPSVDDPKLHSGQGVRQRRHSMDSRDPNTESEAQARDLDAQIRAESDGLSTDEDSHSRELRKKSKKSGQKQSRMVVIRNINYISPQKQDSSGSDSQATASEDDEGAPDTDTNIRKRNSSRKSKQEGKQRNSIDLSRIYEKEDMVSKHGDEGHWQAFQSLLLKDSDDDDKSARRDMFGMEGKVRGRKSHNSAVDDPSIGGRQYLSKDGQPISKYDIVGDMTRWLKPSNDGMLHSGQSISSSDDQRHIQFAEMRGRRLSRANGEDPTIHGGNYLSNQPNSFSDPLIGGELGTGNDQNRSSSHGIRDESFIVPSRLGQVGVDVREAIAMESEISYGELNDNIRGQDSYEPHDLNLVPRRVIEDGMPGFDPALDYQLQAAKVGSNKKIGNLKQGPKNGDKSQGLKSEKKVATVTKRGKPAKFSPSEEARARAEKLRSFKADLQKLKKDKEEEQRKRIEALKMERQKRIAARTGGSSAQTKRPLPTKLSPSSRKGGSKFSDSVPGSSSPLQRSTVKTIPKLSANSHKTSGPSGNRLIKSTTSLVEKKVGKTGPSSNSKLSMARIRRLSEPKERSTVASSVKSRSAESLFRRAVPNDPAVKKSFPIVNLEKSKFSTLPDQKARVSKGQSVLEVAQNNISTKERTPKMAGTDLSYASTRFSQKGNPKVTSQIDNDDNIVVEKTVVVLEQESPSFPAVPDSEGIRDIQSVKFKAYPPKVKEEESVSDNVQASFEVKEIKIDPPCSQSSVQSNSTGAGAAHAGKLLKASDKIISHSPYHAPYARMSSLEDPCTGKSEYTKAPPRNLGMETSGDITTARISDTCKEPKLDKIWEISEKAVEKGSAKGLKRLLKFGKKKQSSVSGETALDSEQATHGDDLGTHDVVTNVGSSGEAFTLKSLISQDEAIREQNSPHKSSRTFSLLSPFRSKTSEKKPST